VSTLAVHPGFATGPAALGAGPAVLAGLVARRRPAGRLWRWLVVPSMRERHSSMDAAAILDLQDIRAALGGDGEAYARLVRRHQQEISRYMWRFSRHAGACEELVQDVFVEAYLSLPTYRGKSPFVHWLKCIATRVGYRSWKARAGKAEPLPPDEPASPAAEPGAMEAADLLHRVLGQLSPRDRLVLTLMYLEQLPVARIAELTGWTTALVKIQAFRARARLKKLLDREETPL
jgi:RNA polymerase sigma-70 factor (ECF subfamily)